LCGLTKAPTRESSKIITYKDLGIMSGLMEENMRVHGGIIRCMVEAYLCGQMAENIKENM